MKKFILPILLCLALLLSGCTVEQSGGDSADKSTASVDTVSKEEPSKEGSDVHSSEEISNEASEAESSAETSEQVSQEETKAESSEEASEEAPVTESSEEASEEAPVTESSEEVSEEAPVTESSEEVSEKNPDNKAYDDFMASLGTDFTLAVAYLGVCEGDFEAVQAYLTENDMYTEFPFLADIKSDSFATGQGAELYMVLCADKDAVVTVSTQGIDSMPFESQQKNGEEIIKAEGGKPILIRGNYSDIFSELVITVTKGQTVVLEYSPSLSLEDGKLRSAAGVCDISPYSLLGMAPYWIGKWYCEVDYDPNTRLALLLDLNDDGSAGYLYGPIAAGAIESFTGGWTAENGAINLNLVSTVYEDGESAYSLNCVFLPSFDGESLVLTHVDGSSFFDTLANHSFTFSPRIEEQ